MQTADADIFNLKLNDEFDLRRAIEAKFGITINNNENITDKLDIIIDKSSLNGGGIGSLNQVISQRKIFDENGQEVGLVNFDFEEEASEGTKKMFNFTGVFVKLIKSGGTIIIDEFDARFHTSLTKAIIKLFNSEKNKAAQLCFVTHDTNLLDNDLLRRDQIYFAEKNQRGETSVYSLNEIKGVRNDSSLEKDYIKGKYGAIPFIKNLNSIFE